MSTFVHADGPAPYDFIDLSSRAFEPSVRFDAWKTVANYALDLLPPPDDAPLDGRLRFVRGAGGAFGCHEGSPHRTEFTRRTRKAGRGECVVLNLMAAGEVALEADDGRRQVAPEGSFALLDAAQPMRYHWSRSRHVYLLLPRAPALRHLGGRLPDLARPLDASPLAPFLRSQMTLLDRDGARLSRRELTAVLDGTLALATLLLEGLGDARAIEAEAAAAGLYAAALRHLDHNLHRIDLDPGTIARELGCSRATLYRAFHAHGVTVAQALRDLRLDRARDRLSRAAASDRYVATVAFACGFHDPSAFGKQFKSRFGLSPRDWREHGRAGQGRTELAPRRADQG
ncbi:helix-turn-helix domain-containing protein [Methylobacterium oryzihabitans]|nr:helix-turn-helix domain-containing protein [Methylobacterium oryzihabitans]